MATAIIYYSEHHGNTKKLLDMICTAASDVELIDVTKERCAWHCKENRKIIKCLLRMNKVHFMVSGKRPKRN